EAHLHERCGAIAELGAAAPGPGQRERVLTRDPEDMHYLQDTAAVLAAVDAAQDELDARQADALARPDLPAPAQELLARHREARREHRVRLAALMGDDTRF